ncbi:MAG: bifunctional metallophosphatase/5'-nucleotidase, partial [Acidimicrobiia bacterium]
MNGKTNGAAWRLLILLAALAVAVVAFSAPASAGKGENNGKGADRAPEVQLQILAINDFHGNIDTASSGFGGTGGADYLAANIRDREAGLRNSIMVSAGDLIGASPLVSALFHDEPT